MIKDDYAERPQADRSCQSKAGTLCKIGNLASGLPEVGSEASIAFCRCCQILNLSTSEGFVLDYIEADFASEHSCSVFQDLQDLCAFAPLQTSFLA